MNVIRVLLVDDHKLIRAGIRSLLEDLPAVEVVAEAGEGGEGLELIKIHQPDVVLLDITMPGMNGIEVAARVRKECPQVRVLILSMHTNEEYVLQALRAGATGYLLKDAYTSELELAINAVSRGEIYLSPAVSRYVVADYAPRNDGRANTLAILTPRQREVLKLIAEGNSTKEIAHLLKVSVKTIETHRSEVMMRLEINNLAGLIRYAIRLGLISAEQV